MKRTFEFITLSCVTIFCLLNSFTPATVSGISQDVFKETNQFRRSKGLNKLISRPELDAIAQRHSNDMAKGRVAFGHDGFDKRNAMAAKEIRPISIFAENVAYGARSGKEVVNMWKNSSGHRKNMLGHFKYIGIGIAKDRQGQIFYTQVFAG
jgi:uncharacterized protein YkwD